MSTATSIVEALGGWDNISNLEACITRIRLDAANTDLIDEAKLRAAGASTSSSWETPFRSSWAPTPRTSSTRCSPAGDARRPRALHRTRHAPV